MYTITYICRPASHPRVRAMKTSTVTEFRQKIKKHLDGLEADQDILILSRPRRKGFVVLPMDLYQSLEETAHLLSTPSNAERLARGIRQAKQGKTSVKKVNL